MKIVDLTGKQISNWFVLERIKRENGHGTKTYYKCQCKCGREKLVEHSNLQAGLSKWCRECEDKTRREKGPQTKLASVFCRYRKGAERRKLPFLIDKAYALEVMEKQEWTCPLTGIKLYIEGAGDNTKTNASLDRIDSRKGYIEGNVQWVYMPINTMKWDLTQKEFIRLCQLVAKHNPETD